MSQITALAKCTFNNPELADLAKRMYAIIYDPHPKTRDRVSAIAVHSENVEDILGNLFYIVSNPELAEDKNSIFITIEYPTREDDLEILNCISQINRLIGDTEIFFLSFNDQIGEWNISSNSSGSAKYVYGTGGPHSSLQDQIYAFELNYKSLTDCLALYEESNFSKSNIRSVDELAETQSRDRNAELQIGVTVRHSKFGLGKVISFDGEGRNHAVEVEFENVGKKLLLTALGKLTVENDA